jgi:type II restriction enzyme
MQYKDRISKLTEYISPTLVDFSQPRGNARVPTQASSEFITNKEQGDWAEKLITQAINTTSQHYVAVKYGKSDDLIAGEEGFIEFFREFQDEMDSIGKRPDLLIFRKGDYDPQLGEDISQIDHSQITEYVKKAVAGIEVRSSAFLIDRYKDAMQQRMTRFTKTALQIRDTILADYQNELNHSQRKKYIPILRGLTEETLTVADFKVPGWSSSERLVSLNTLFKELKQAVKEIQKRDHLSITVKIEDLKVVDKWIETFNVPHFYFQVFFDKVYGISFEQILTIISDSDQEGRLFSVEKDIKNQNKTTIKIDPKAGILIAMKVDEPNHQSVRKEMNRGRLLFYVKFEGGTAYLDVQNLCNILSITEESF